MASSIRGRTNLTLFSSRDGLDSHRIRLILAAKGVSFELVSVDLAFPPEDLLDLNPYHTLPTLADRDLVLYDTGVIAEYLDERYPHPPLMPIDPLSRARVRLGVARLVSDWFPHVASIIQGPRATSEASRKRLREQVIGSLPVFKMSKFFLSNEFTLADCTLVPLLWRLPALGVVLPREFKPIEDYAEKLFRHPGFERSLTSEERAMRPASAA
ncbi:MAG: glutathione S-transferase N-terminal domain-containing protein [Lysobacterales bacterium]